MDDKTRRHLADLMAGPLGEEIDTSLAWAEEHTGHSDVEIFLHPADAEPVAGGEYDQHPIRQSIGVPRGDVLIFDRKTGQYIRKGEQP